jgi:hypothetical protein
MSVQTICPERNIGRNEYEQKAYLNGYWEDKTYHMGRLDGILIPSYMYKNKNEPEIVIG